MTIRKVLVPIDGTAAARAALETALAVGTLMRSHVEALHVRIEPAAAVPFVGEGMSGALLQDLIDLTERQIAQRAADARALFDQVCGSRGVAVAELPHPDVAERAGPSAAYVEVLGQEDEATVARARLADLAVLARPNGGPDRPGSAVFDAVLLESGGPVLIAPPAAPGALVRHVAVAWNDSGEAARALKAALPLLARADRVSLIAVAEEEGGAPDPLAAVAAFLAWHGIAASTHVVTAPGSTGQALVDACADADLVVMGAYTHSRLWRLILGGVTQHMIADTALPLLMAH
jgi:nucleotide-binding universal stress UspA family protein